MDLLLLSRLQFAFTIMFHYIFPPLSIGLGALLVVMEGLYLKTGDKDYEALARFYRAEARADACGEGYGRGPCSVKQIRAGLTSETRSTGIPIASRDKRGVEAVDRKEGKRAELERRP